MPNLEIFKAEKAERMKSRTGDPATQYMIDYVEGLGFDSVFTRQQRYDGKLMGVMPKSRCDFGSLGICCRQCLMGPCRIWHENVDTPLRVNAPSQTRGTCGASADVIVARNWLVYHSRGCAAHAATAKDTAETLLKTARGKTTYQIKDTAKLDAVSAILGIDASLSKEKKAEELAMKVIVDIMGKPGAYDDEAGMEFAHAYLAPKDLERIKELDIMPKSAYEDLADADHQCAVGMMSDPYYFVMQSLKVGLGDVMSLWATTEMHDVLLGTPTPVPTQMGINVLKENMVNIAVHGHIPTLCEKLVEHSETQAIQDKIKLAGAEGINFVGLCCTGAEVLQRHQIPLAGNNLQEDLVIATGIVDSFLMDVQCSYPSGHDMAEQFHTKVITTMKDARVPNADHIPFDDTKADEWALQALEVSINNFAKRPNKTHLPPFEPTQAMAGFSVEACLKVLSVLDAENPLKPLIDAIVSGAIRGVCVVAGCNSPKVSSDTGYTDLAIELLKNDVLILGTGCAAGSCGRGGLLDPVATEKYAGEKLKGVLHALGKAAGLPGPLPPVWHMGSCVDNSRAFNLASALSKALDVRTAQLPVVVSAAEVVTEKAVSISSGAVALGMPVHLAVIPPVLGSPAVNKLLTEDMKDLTGGYFFIQPNPVKAANELLAAINDRRKGLGLEV